MPMSVADMPTVGDRADGESPSLARQIEWARAFGPIYRRRAPPGAAGGDRIFMVGPEANRFVLHTGRNCVSNDLGWTPIIGGVLGKGLLNMDGIEHDRHRRLWNPAFTRAATETYLPVIGRIVRLRTAGWPDQADIDVYQETLAISFDATAAALAGFEPGPQVDHMRRLYIWMLHGYDPASGPFSAFRVKLAEARAELDRILLPLIQQRCRAPESEAPRDVLGMVARARDEHGVPLTDEELLGHVNILLAAGHETTASLSTWMLYHLATQPGERQRLEQEIRSLVMDSEDVHSAEALRGAHALDRFIMEVGRLHSPAINLPRCVVKPFEFAGYAIPAGSQIRLAVAAGHRLPHVFRDPDDLDPDRFAPPREEHKRHPYGLVTFGGGSRVCIGASFAELVIKVLAGHILRTLRLEVPAERPIAYGGNWTAYFPGGLRMRAVRRTLMPSGAPMVPSNRA